MQADETEQRVGVPYPRQLFRRHGGEFTWDDKMAVMGTSYEHTSVYFADRLGLPLPLRRL